MHIQKKVVKNIKNILKTFSQLIITNICYRISDVKKLLEVHWQNEMSKFKFCTGRIFSEPNTSVKIKVMTKPDPKPAKLLSLI